MKDAMTLLSFACLIFNLVSPKYAQVNEFLPLEHASYNVKLKLLMVVQK